MSQIVILTGAGISAESGLNTFRGGGGLWENHRVEDVATPEAFARNPALVQRFYNERRAGAAKAQPNAAHIALTDLGHAFGDDLLLVTQNVDSLHEAGGSRAVVHMHGQLDQALCASCGHRWPSPTELEVGHACPSCGAPSARPDIVWFGEIPYHMDRILEALSQAEVFAAIGTSGQVYPAAGFGEFAQQAGAECHELTLEPSGNPIFDRVIAGPATHTVPLWVAEIKERFATKGRAGPGSDAPFPS
ncbi:NAD-dependent deacylase [Shimia ponticola]|uniref:NAD-dependent deacylase n=1 Tax=Shimia ponticola TaxID=2582893 RepID=UPI0011BD7D5A|nr:NAD-dependent deacylase [Shimia ponticola]